MGRACVLVSEELLLDRLFPGGGPLLLRGIARSRFGTLLIDVEGPYIPEDAPGVLEAIITEKRSTVCRFELIRSDETHKDKPEQGLPEPGGPGL